MAAEAAGFTVVGQCEIDKACNKVLATPTANDAKNATLPPSQNNRSNIPGDLVRMGMTGALNPDWVECLMGFPPGWTAPAGLPEKVPSNTTGSRRE